MKNRSGSSRAWIALLTCATGLGFVNELRAQQVLITPEQTITVSRGQSVLLNRPNAFERVSIADPNIADGTTITPTDLLIIGKTTGTTSLMIWSANDRVRLYNIEVTADIAGLERQLNELFPDAGVTLSAQGNTVILSGVARDPSVLRRALEISEAAGVQVIDNMTSPFPQQILLHVQFAEVSKTAVRRFGTRLEVAQPQLLNETFDQDDGHYIESVSDGLLQLLFFNCGLESTSGEICPPGSTSFNAFLNALKSTGDFRSLAEPNLLAIEGQEASFLAGGEFPYPAIQGQNANAVTIQFREFGIRLRFTPTITASGNIRLNLAPEVSSLDFANGLTFSGFQVPSILSRRAETTVELAAGQHLAIAGLLDNSMVESADKIPVLGDIPILGHFFRSSSYRKNHTELLVVVTPYLVTPQDEPIELPTGEPETWDKWEPFQSKTTRPAPGGNQNQ